ncbi:MAG: acetyl-CoA acetyltransferase [Acidimicrobiia bacterium]
MTQGIRDRAAIAGVGCTPFGEHWEAGPSDMLADACFEAFSDAGVEPSDVDAIWVGSLYPFTGLSGGMAVDALKLFGKPATHVENFCASGLDAFRNACYAVAAGVCDVALACGVEKILDQSASGLPLDVLGAHPVMGSVSAPAVFALAATRAMEAWGWTREDLAAVAVKNHDNGADHPKAHFRRQVSVDQVLGSPCLAWPLGRLDACGVSDGAAAAVITRPELAAELPHKDDFPWVKAVQLSVHTGWPVYKSDVDYLGFPATRQAARQAYEEAGITDPRADIGLAEVHDCFTITELLNIGDLGLCDQPEAAAFVNDGRANFDGEIPVNASGGLKSFGHPIGATGCRMIYEVTRQLQERADGRQVKDASFGLAHNLGGQGSAVAVTILGANDTGP